MNCATACDQLKKRFASVSATPRKRVRNPNATGWVKSASTSILRAVSALPITSSTRSEEHTSELQSLMRISYAVFCLKKQKPLILTRETKTSALNTQHSGYSTH